MIITIITARAIIGACNKHSAAEQITDAAKAKSAYIKIPYISVN